MNDNGELFRGGKAKGGEFDGQEPSFTVTIRAFDNGVTIETCRECHPFEIIGIIEVAKDMVLTGG